MQFLVPRKGILTSKWPKALFADVGFGPGVLWVVSIPAQPPSMISNIAYGIVHVSAFISMYLSPQSRKAYPEMFRLGEGFLTGFTN